MPLTIIIILAIVQGLTEFLPVSSSGHLVLVHHLSDSSSAERWAQDLLLDVAVHVGTLLSVLLYFRRDVCAMACGFVKTATGQKDGSDSRLLGYVVLGSLPVIAAGFLLHLWAPGWLRSIEIMAWATILFGVLLWWADRTERKDKDLSHLGWREALIIGIAQILALVPGTSRSGITMTAARFLGFSRTESAHFSLLLAIIAISGAGALAGLDLWQSGDIALTLDALLAAALAFIAGWLSIAAMMKFLEKRSFLVFALYRIALGGALLALIYSGALAV